MKPLIIKKTVESIVDEYQCQKCSCVFGTLYDYESHWKNSHSFTKILKTPSGKTLYYFESQEDAKKFGRFLIWDVPGWYIQEYDEYDEQWRLVSVNAWVKKRDFEIQEKQREIEENRQAMQEIQRAIA